MSIRLLTFDALFTLLRPTQPFHIQYARTFQPYFGSLDPESIRLSFKRGQSSSRSRSRVLVAEKRAPAFASLLFRRP